MRERDFYGAIGYLPLGNHAIRADMVERLAAMARPAVRESRENARRAAQQEKREPERDREQKPTPGPFDGRPQRRRPAPATDAEISEWAIVAAAFGENEPTPGRGEVPSARAVAETAPVEPTGSSAESDAAPVAEPKPLEPSRPACGGDATRPRRPRSGRGNDA